MDDRNETGAEAQPPVDGGAPEPARRSVPGSSPESSPGSCREPFHAVIRPHRSLGPGGFFVLMLLVCVVSFIAGMAFLLMGAWPVLGFFGLDALLVYLAFKLNYYRGRAEEHVRLDETGLTVRRFTPAGRWREWRFNPYWVRVDFAEHDDGTSELALVSHGRRLDIAAWLSPDERADFAFALNDALRAARG